MKKELDEFQESTGMTLQEMKERMEFIYESFAILYNEEDNENIWVPVLTEMIKTIVSCSKDKDEWKEVLQKAFDEI